MELGEIKDALRNCELFRKLKEAEIDVISGLCKMETYKAGENLFLQGDLGDNLYVIAEGQVVLERSMDLGTRKGTVTIGMLGKGRALGSWSTLLNESHSLMSSAMCRKPSKVVVMEGGDLREMMLQDLGLGFNVLERLCFLLRDRIQSAYGALEKI